MDGMCKHYIKFFLAKCEANIQCILNFLKEINQAVGTRLGVRLETPEDLSFYPWGAPSHMAKASGVTGGKAVDTQRRAMSCGAETRLLGEWQRVPRTRQRTRSWDKTRPRPRYK